MRPFHHWRTTRSELLLRHLRHVVESATAARTRDRTRSVVAVPGGRRWLFAAGTARSRFWAAPLQQVLAPIEDERLLAQVGVRGESEPDGPFGRSRHPPPRGSRAPRRSRARAAARYSPPGSRNCRQRTLARSRSRLSRRRRCGRRKRRGCSVKTATGSGRSVRAASPKERRTQPPDRVLPHGNHHCVIATQALPSRSPQRRPVPQKIFDSKGLERD